MKVTTTRIEGHRALVYRYDVNKDIGFKFHLACEVGDPWIAEARHKAQALADKHHCRIVKVELNASPWYVEALEPIGATP